MIVQYLLVISRVAGLSPVVSRVTCQQGKVWASAIVHTCSSPIFIVFSYAFSEDSVKPKLTAYVSDKKVITVKFPWESIGGLFMELMCTREFAEENDRLRKILNSRLLHFLINHFHLF